MSEYKRARDIASKSLYYIDGLSSAREAIEKMKQHGVDTLVIKKRNNQDANGILVIADIVRGVILPDLNLDEVSVYEIMSKPVISVPASLNARYVPRLLNKAKINVAPVEENGDYIGIVHLRDILFSM
jgi:signal-transduction protein with cAMP-binding, CBS, and nucleotidyltransferase domain